MSSLRWDKIQIWYFITFCLGLVEGLVGTFFPLVFLEQGGSLFSLSLVLGLVSLVGALQTVWGRIIDIYGKPKQLGYISLAIQTATVTTMGLTTDPIIFGTSRIGNSLSIAGYNTSHAYLRSAYFSSLRRGRVGNLFMGFNLFGVTIGVMFAGIYYNRQGIGSSNFIHLIAGLISLVAMIFLIRSIPEFRDDLIQDEQLREALFVAKADLQFTLKDTIRLIQKSKGLIAFSSATLVFHFGVGLAAPFFIVELNEFWQLSTFEIGIIMTINTLIQVFIIFLFVPIVDIINRKIAFSVGITLAIVPVIGMIIPPYLVSNVFSNFYIYWIIVHIFSSIGWGIVNSLLLTLLIDYVHPKIRGTFIGVYGSLQAVMIFLASLLAGFLINTIFSSTLPIFVLSIYFRFVCLLLLLIVPSPPIPSSEFYLQRKIFMSKFYANMERGISWIPIVGKVIIKHRNGLKSDI